MKNLILLMVMICAALVQAAERTNVLFLVCDDMNSLMLGDINRYTGKVIAPNLKKLAQSGVSFQQAYAAAPVCSPSRTAFFSGVAPWKSGHYHNVPGVKDSEPLKKALSLAACFKNAGYYTAGYGKITHGWDQKEGWDENVGHKRDPAPPEAPCNGIARNKDGEGVTEMDWGPIHLPEEKMNDSMNADKAIAQLEKKHDKPFFLCYGTFNPHMPWYVPQKYFDMFPLDEIADLPRLENDLDDVPPLGRALASVGTVQAVLEKGVHKQGIQAYLATTAYADVQMGRVLDALEKSPYRDNTIVVFLTDNGFHLGEKDHWQKATLWEQATHIMLTIKVPGVTPADGAVCQRYVSLLDVYPTLAELCGLDAPDSLDGHSLLPLLKNPDAEWKSTAMTGLTGKPKTEFAYISYRNEQGRYIRYGSDQEEFYDEIKDPHEWTNEINNPEYAPVLKTFREFVPSFSEMAIPMPCLLKEQKTDGKKEKKNKK